MKAKLMKTRILALLLVLFMLTGTFYACNSDPKDAGNAAGGGAGENAAGENSAGSESESDILAIINIQDYTIIYPKDSIGLEQASADYLSDYISDKTGKKLSVADDGSAEGQYEILIGDTNRSSSKEAAGLNYGENDLLIKADGAKVVLYGKDLMAAGAVGQFISQYIGDADIQVSKSAGIVKFEMKDLKNAILMIGDGMGFSHVELAKSNGLASFKAEFLPNKGEIITDSLSSGATDSAAAATALACGWKTTNGYVGMNKAKEPVKTVRELAYEIGYKTAIVTTDSLDGATPAAFLAHINDRNKSKEIYEQIDEVKANEGDMVYVAGTSDKPVFDDFKAALKQISTDSKGFFMMFEEGYIDKYAHSNEADPVVKCVSRYDEAIAYTIAFVMAHPDTALIITADHETGGLKIQDDGTFKFTSGDHTRVNVPMYTWGKGTEIFGSAQENTEVAKFIANIFGESNFGQE